MQKTKYIADLGIIYLWCTYTNQINKYTDLPVICYLDIKINLLLTETKLLYYNFLKVQKLKIIV